MDRKVQRIERQHGGGIRVTMADGTSATYQTAAAMPDELVALLGRMDAADGDGQPQGDADAARSAYRQRLESAHEQGRLRHDPGHGLTGEAAYRARLESAWQTQQSPRDRPGDHKRWGGA